MILVLLFYAVFTPLSTILGELAENNGINEYIILAITMISNFVLEYLYTRFFVYKDSCDTAIKNDNKTLTYKTLRFFINIFYKKRTFEGIENIEDEPSIIIGNHAQMHGPLVAELQFPLNRKTWCIGDVLTKNEFIEHAKTDFWGKKPKYIRWFYIMLAYIIAPIGANVFNSADIIPVYKDSRLAKTFKKTVRELNAGNNIIIFPECTTPFNNIINEFQDKYIDVARLYYNITGKCLAFVPMYNAVRLHKVLLGKPIKYDPNIPIDEMRKIINDYLKKEITSLALSLPPHKVVQFVNNGRKNNPISK